MGLNLGTLQFHFRGVAGFIQPGDRVDVGQFPVRPRGGVLTLLAAAGGLSMHYLGLNVTIYDLQVHYQQM